MTQLPRRIEVPVVVLLFLAGSAFLLKMCYLSLALNTVFGAAFLAMIYCYTRSRLGLKIPLVLLALVFAALQVDALGNYFRMYGQDFGPIRYDEFSHLSVQVLVTPVFVWLLTGFLNSRGYRLSLALTSLFAGSLVFSLAAFYEVIELWDELYFGGQRIWGPHDSATDLQWDLCGVIIGAVIANIVLSAKAFTRRSVVPVT